MKKILIILITFFIFFLISLFIAFLPNYKEKSDINRLKKEISMVDNYINKKKGNIIDINQYINKNVTENRILENSVDGYLKDILNSYEMIKNIDSNEIINIDFSKDDVDNILSKIINNNEILNKSKKR